MTLIEEMQEVLDKHAGEEKEKYKVVWHPIDPILRSRVNYPKEVLTRFGNILDALIETERLNQLCPYDAHWVEEVE